MKSFAIGQNVTSHYYGITGTVIAYGVPFGGRQTIVVKHQVNMLDNPAKKMTDSRTFLAQDFKTA
jgi:hypothetical protein